MDIFVSYTETRVNFIVLDHLLAARARTRMPKVI